jgi:integrase
MASGTPCHPCHLDRGVGVTAEGKPDRPELTPEFVAAATCPPGRKDVLIFDGRLRGFGVRITANGVKVFLFQYRAGTAVQRVALGRFGQVTPAQARKLAGQLAAEVTAGRDPKGERKARADAAVAEKAARKRQAEADALTFSVLVKRWQDLHLAGRRESYRHEAPRALLVSFATWSGRPASSIAAKEAIERLDRIAQGSGPAAARSAFAYARAMFGWAVKRQLVEANPFAGIHPPRTVADRDRHLSDEELGAVWRAASDLAWPMGGFIMMAVLTLQRREEVAAMRWVEISKDRTTWTIPAERAKNGKAHLVHLAAPARKILRDAIRIKGSPFVFTTTGKTPVSGFSATKASLDKAIAEARRKARVTPHAIPAWRLHDLRRTGVTRLAALGFAPHVCDRLLNHVKGSIAGVAAVYQRHEFLPERQAALEAWAKHVLAVAEGKRRQRASAEVVELEAVRQRRRSKA